MGVRTTLTMDEIKPFFDARRLRATVDGVRDTVYILDDAYVLKIFEESTPEAVREEVKLLELCTTLAVPKVLTPVLSIRDKPALVYEKCRGQSLQRASTEEIRQIGVFLKQFHTLTQHKYSTNTPLFEKNRVYTMIEKTGYKPFLDLFEKLSITLKNDGIIHGDLFLDNASFADGRLTCVYDLSEACNGDFLFDLAVTALSWCPHDTALRALLDGYGHTIEPEEFKEYIRYAGLYYSTTRFLADRNFDTLWERIQ